MNFYISIITHPVEYGFFRKRKVDELVSVCVVTETAQRYYAVNKRAAKWRIELPNIMELLPHESSFLWKDTWVIANEISSFIKFHTKEGVDNIMWGYQPAQVERILRDIKLSAGPVVHSLYQEAYWFVVQNEDYIRTCDAFTVQPLHFGIPELENILAGHERYPKAQSFFDVKERAYWNKDFHSFLEKIKMDMLLSSIPESNE